MRRAVPVPPDIVIGKLDRLAAALLAWTGGFPNQLHHDSVEVFPSSGLLRAGFHGKWQRLQHLALREFLHPGFVDAASAHGMVNKP